MRILIFPSKIWVKKVCIIHGKIWCLKVTENTCLQHMPLKTFQTHMTGYRLCLLSVLPSAPDRLPGTSNLTATTRSYTCPRHSQSDPPPDGPPEGRRRVGPPGQHRAIRCATPSNRDRRVCSGRRVPSVEGESWQDSTAQAHHQLCLFSSVIPRADEWLVLPRQGCHLSQRSEHCHSDKPLGEQEKGNPASWP